MASARERAQASARSALVKGLTAAVVFVLVMSLFYSSGNQVIVVAAGVGVLGALIYTVASIIALRTHR